MATRDVETLRVVIGLGANLGDRAATLREAVRSIAAVEGVRVGARSRIYETDAVGGVEQPPFLNAAISAECTLVPRALLEALLAIEASLGRDRSADTVRWGPRRIDLDVLWIDGRVVDEAGLSVPHPRVTERAFAMVPLLEVAPGAVDPYTKQRYVAPADDGVRVTSLDW